MERVCLSMPFHTRIELIPTELHLVQQVVFWSRLSGVWRRNGSFTW